MAKYLKCHPPFPIPVGTPACHIAINEKTNRLGILSPFTKFTPSAWKRITEDYAMKKNAAGSWVPYVATVNLKKRLELEHGTLKWERTKSSPSVSTKPDKPRVKTVKALFYSDLYAMKANGRMLCPICYKSFKGRAGLIFHANKYHSVDYHHLSDEAIDRLTNEPSTLSTVTASTDVELLTPLDLNTIDLD